MINSIFVFIGVYVCYSFCYVLGLGKAIQGLTWAAQADNFAPVSIYGFGVVLVITWLVARK